MWNSQQEKHLCFKSDFYAEYFFFFVKFWCICIPSNIYFIWSCLRSNLNDRSNNKIYFFNTDIWIMSIIDLGSNSILLLVVVVVGSSGTVYCFRVCIYFRYSGLTFFLLLFLTVTISFNQSPHKLEMWSNQHFLSRLSPCNSWLVIFNQDSNTPLI